MSAKARHELLFLVGVLLVLPFGSDGASAQNRGSSIRATTAAPQARRPADAWVPPDIDAVTLPVNSSAACSLPVVLAGAGRRVQQTVTNLERFTATESVEHQSVNGAGKLSRVQTRKFDYLVSIGPGRGGYLTMREYRSRSANPEQFPDRIATEGTPVLMLVFHPLYARDFDMKCEGLSEWRGQPAWQVRFEQRRDRQNRLSNIVMGDKSYGVRLRGRAWILADSYQVARLETDLADTIPAINLRLEHMNVEYLPVDFHERQTQLWLPASAELYLDFSGRRFYRKHTFTDFTLFSVDVEQGFASASAYPQ